MLHKKPEFVAKSGFISQYKQLSTRFSQIKEGLYGKFVPEQGRLGTKIGDPYEMYLSDICTIPIIITFYELLL